MTVHNPAANTPQLAWETPHTLRYLMRASPTAMVVLDRAGDIQACNGAAERLYGVRSADLVGHPCPIAPDEKAADFAALLARVLGGEIIDEVEICCRRRDGTTLFLSVALSPVVDAEGRIVGALKMLADRTEQRIAVYERDHLFALSPDLMAIIGYDGIFRQLNPAWTEALGWRREELLGHSWLEFIHPDDVAPSLAKGAVLPAGAVMKDLANRYRSKNGSYRWLAWTVFPLPDASLVFAVARDITEPNRQARLMEQTSAAAQIGGWELDCLTMTLFWTEETYRIHETSPAQYSPNVDTAISYYAAESRPLIAEAVRRGIELGEAWDLELELITAKSNRIWVRAIGKVHQENGKTVKLYGAFQNIAERKRAEQQLRLLTSVVVHANDAVVITEAAPMDPPGPRILYVNDAFTRMTGYDADEVQGQTPRVLQGPKTDRAKLEQIHRALAAGQAVAAELVNYRKDGSEFDIEFSIFPIADDTGCFTHWVAIQRDVTERKRAVEERLRLEAKIQQAQKLESLGVLAGGIAHDFNNILTSVLGFADLALLELPPASPARFNIEQVITGARRAADLTKQMLAYSGKGKFVIQALQMSDVVREMSHLVQVSISKKCALRYQFADDLPAIEADATQLRQIVMNLIVNASEAIGDKSGGIISVQTGIMHCDRAYLDDSYVQENLPEGAYVFLEVSDNGAGMSEATRRKIFEPFFTTKFTGRGLGLAAVLGIVRGHRGAIKVYSESGRGTIFKVLFPISKQTPAALSDAGNESPTWRGRGSILVVDDEESVRTLARAMLERLGFTVLTAGDGREGLEVFRTRADEIQGVLLDVTMPYMDGEETFRELRRLKSDVRVILSSGYNEQSATHRFAGKGLAGFIQKPYRIQELVDVLRRALER